MRRGLLLLVALAIMMQAGAMVGTWLYIQRIHRQMEGIRVEVRDRFEPLTRSFAEILSDTREPVRTITVNLGDQPNAA